MYTPVYHFWSGARFREIACIPCLHAWARPSCAIPCHRLPIVFVGDLKAESATHQRDLPICGLIRRKAIRAKTNVLTARSCPLARLKSGREFVEKRTRFAITYRAAQLPKCRLKVPPPQSAFIVYIALSKRSRRPFSCMAASSFSPSYRL